ncbi:hypothetical protein KEM48_006103 [Puccinia striiformis f. sp. tritici PST-130]|nr:hypothetical protein KEM48_006103 [Puccinia striiformis f. sp. tritici PST-130]
MYPSSQHSSEQQQHQHHPRRQTSLLCTTESISFSNTQDVRDRSTQIQRASQSETDLNLLDSNNPATGYDQWAFPSPAGGSSNIRLPASASSSRRPSIINTTSHSIQNVGQKSLVWCTARTILDIPVDVVSNYPISNTLKNVSSSPTTRQHKTVEPEHLLFSNPSLDPARSLDRIFSFLDATGLLAGDRMLAAPQCPRPGNLSPHRLIDSLSVYTPAMTADTILVLDAASLSHNLDRAWLTAAAELALSRSRIVAAVAASPARLPSAWPTIVRNEIPRARRKGEDEEEDVDQILRGHLQASVGILITQTDIDRPGSSSNEDTDWLTLMCKLIERFDAEIYLLSSYQDGTDGSEDQEQRNKRMTFAHQQQQRRQQEDSSFDGAGEPLEDQEDLEDDQDEDEQDECVLIGLPSDEVMAADWILGLDIQADQHGADGGPTNTEASGRIRMEARVETVRKRIIQGGLLPAVVESWYPSSAYDSYGYYWRTMWKCLDTFTAGSSSPCSSTAILADRQGPFTASHSINPNTASFVLRDVGLSMRPTLLMGALFFPETWTDFERYLPSDWPISSRPPTQPACDPSPIRSNRWPKSWKKYLIEWVYLRGQVMIYPNYHQLNQTSPDETLIDNLNEWGADGRLIPTGLSTNHLEVGTHVHNRDYVRPSHKLQYEQHQQGKLRFTKWGESTIGQTRVIGGEEGKEERKRKAQLAAAQLKREFAIALKPLLGDQSLLDGLSPSGSLHPRLPSVTSLTAFDLWAEPTALDIIRHRGFFAALSSGICDPYESLHRAHLDRVTKAKAASVIFPPQPSDRLEMLTAICQ